MRASSHLAQKSIVYWNQQQDKKSSTLQYAFRCSDRGRELSYRTSFRKDNKLLCLSNSNICVLSFGRNSHSCPPHLISFSLCLCSRYLFRQHGNFCHAVAVKRKSAILHPLSRIPIPGKNNVSIQWKQWHTVILFTIVLCFLLSFKQKSKEKQRENVS